MSALPSLPEGLAEGLTPEQQRLVHEAIATKVDPGLAERNIWYRKDETGLSAADRYYLKRQGIVLPSPEDAKSASRAAHERAYERASAAKDLLKAQLINRHGAAGYEALRAEGYQKLMAARLGEPIGPLAVAPVKVPDPSRKYAYEHALAIKAELMQWLSQEERGETYADLQEKGHVRYQLIRLEERFSLERIYGELPADWRAMSVAEIYNHTVSRLYSYT